MIRLIPLLFVFLLGSCLFRAAQMKRTPLPSAAPEAPLTPDTKDAFDWPDDPKNEIDIKTNYIPGSDWVDLQLGMGDLLDLFTIEVCNTQDSAPCFRREEAADQTTLLLPKKGSYNVTVRACFKNKTCKQSLRLENVLVNKTEADQVKIANRVDALRDELIVAIRGITDRLEKMRPIAVRGNLKPIVTSIDHLLALTINEKLVLMSSLADLVHGAKTPIVNIVDNAAASSGGTSTPTNDSASGSGGGGSGEGAAGVGVGASTSSGSSGSGQEFAGVATGAGSGSGENSSSGGGGAGVGGGSGGTEEQPTFNSELLGIGLGLGAAAVLGLAYYRFAHLSRSSRAVAIDPPPVQGTGEQGRPPSDLKATAVVNTQPPPTFAEGGELTREDIERFRTLLKEQHQKVERTLISLEVPVIEDGARNADTRANAPAADAENVRVDVAALEREVIRQVETQLVLYRPPHIPQVPLLPTVWEFRLPPSPIIIGPTAFIVANGTMGAWIPDTTASRPQAGQPLLMIKDGQVEEQDARVLTNQELKAPLLMLEDVKQAVTAAVTEVAVRNPTNDELARVREIFVSANAHALPVWPLPPGRNSGVAASFVVEKALMGKTAAHHPSPAELLNHRSDTLRELNQRYPQFYPQLPVVQNPLPQHLVPANQLARLGHQAQVNNLNIARQRVVNVGQKAMPFLRKAFFLADEASELTKLLADLESLATKIFDLRNKIAAWIVKYKAKKATA